MCAKQMRFIEIIYQTALETLKIEIKKVGMKVGMLLMSFTFPMDTSISPHFHILLHGLELKIWLFGVLLRH